MGTSSKLAGQFTIGLLKNNAAGWQAVFNLLDQRNYEEAATLLHFIKNSPAEEPDPALIKLFAAAHQLCLTCHQYQAEVDLQKQAFQDAVERERELSEQLVNILQLLQLQNGDGPIHSPENNAAQTRTESPTTISKSASNSWWQRLISFVGSMPILNSQPNLKVVNNPHINLSEASQVYAPGASPPHPDLVIYCLGSFRVYQNDQLINDWNGLKGQAIFKYLIAQKGGPIPRDILVDLLWPDVDPMPARRNLHQAVYSLRQTLRREAGRIDFILFQNDCYLLNPDLTIWVDVYEFEDHVVNGRHLEAEQNISEAMKEYSIAEGLYQGGFLADDIYDEWAHNYHEHLKNLYLDIADKLSEFYLNQGNYTAALVLCQKILTQDKCHEEAHRRVMRCYQAQNQRYLAVRTYLTCRELMKSELGLEPSDETTLLYQQIIS